jgi:hypothetical protein
MFLKTQLTIGGSNFGDVLAYDLAAKVLRIAIPRDSISIDGAERAWVASLHSLSSDAAILYFTLAVERPNGQGEQVEYSLARMQLAEKRLEILTRLRDVFF